LARPGPARLTPQEGRSFAFTLGAAFAALAGVAWWRHHPRALVAFAGLAALLLLAGALAPTRLGPVRRAWMGLAHAISRVTTPLFLGVLYFLVITPSAWLRRAFGGNPLRRTRGRPTGWVDRRGGPPGDMARQF
jgi:hypothetical protein